VTNRSLERMGDFFLLFGKIWWSIRIIVGHFAATRDTERVMKFMALNSNFGEILRIFMYFDRVLLQTEFFTSHLAATVVKDWHSFCKAMRRVIAQDDKLFMGLFPRQ
jgi:hypothetical protein